MFHFQFSLEITPGLRSVLPQNCLHDIVLSPAPPPAEQPYFSNPLPFCSKVYISILYLSSICILATYLYFWLDSGRAGRPIFVFALGASQGSCVVTGHILILRGQHLFCPTTAESPNTKNKYTHTKVCKYFVYIQT